MTTKKQTILGSLGKGVLGNLGLWLLGLILGAIFGGPKIALEPKTALVVFLGFLAVYLLITFLAVFSWLPKRLAGQLQEEGIFSYVRHPMYSAIIFVLNPGLAILLRSWLLIIACVPVYFIWRSAIKSEEKELTGTFGDQYLKYKRAVWPFFPNLFKINKPLFLAASGLAIFIVSFVFLNYAAFYLQLVEWRGEKPAQIVVPLASQPGNGTSGANLPTSETVPTQTNPDRPRPKYEKGNSIVIAKIGLDAPLVSSAGPTQKEMNAALNQGVLIYPGGVLPGQIGNLFLTGHSSTYIWNKTPYGQVFTLLDRLNPGDSVTVYYNQEKFEYQVTKKYVTAPENVSVNTATTEKIITLYTCWPIGTALKRLVIEGVQID